MDPSCIPFPNYYFMGKEPRELCADTTVSLEQLVLKRKRKTNSHAKEIWDSFWDVIMPLKKL